MREPTRLSVLYGPWREMLARAGERRSGQSPIYDWEPTPGWYRTRFVKGGPAVPVRVWCERDIDPETGELADDERILCEIDGERRRRLPAGLVYHAITREAFDRIMSDRARDIRYRATLAPFDITAVAPRP